MPAEEPTLSYASPGVANTPAIPGEPFSFWPAPIWPRVVMHSIALVLCGFGLFVSVGALSEQIPRFRPNYQIVGCCIAALLCIIAVAIPQVMRLVRLSRFGRAAITFRVDEHWLVIDDPAQFGPKPRRVHLNHVCGFTIRRDERVSRGYVFRIRITGSLFPIFVYATGLRGLMEQRTERLREKIVGTSHILLID